MISDGSEAVSRSQPSTRYRLALATVIVFFAYSISVGGDAWEGEPLTANRFVSPVMPLVFVLFTGLLNEVRARVSDVAPRAALKRFAGPVAAALTLIAFLQTNEVWLRPWQSEEWRRLMLTQRPLHASHVTTVRDTPTMKSFAGRDALLASV